MSIRASEKVRRLTASCVLVSWLWAVRILFAAQLGSHESACGVLSLDVPLVDVFIQGISGEGAVMLLVDAECSLTFSE